MTELPTGTVTFLFTDVEGSTRLWEEHPDAMPDVVARHDALLREVVEQHGGVHLSSMGDGIAAAFGSAGDAVAAALDVQLRVADEAPAQTGPLGIRMGLHAAEARLRPDGEYENRPLNRCARLMAVGHGGQVLVSDSVHALVRDGLPSDATLVSLGEHRLRDLAEPIRVFQLAHPGLRPEFPPLRSLDALPGNLPLQMTTFVGREDEIAAIAALVREHRLVTITGVGGVGKTRLALQVAAEVAPAFGDGAWLCELAAVSDPEAVSAAMASSLGLTPPIGRTVEEAMLDFLAVKHLLLVIDNCEHLLAASSALVRRIVQRSPSVSVMATSREGLGVAGEQLVAIPSLDVPGTDALDQVAGADAVRLFVDRAREVSRAFTVTDDNAVAVAHLCRRLDGIPLAIELAAARVRALSPQDLVDRIDQRFKLLTRGSRAALERHQTLRSTIDWSYDLLTDVERRVLNRLGVFAGGCTLAAAEAVVGDDELDAADVDDVLAQLVDKSLVVVDDGEGDAPPRYRLLETIRQYAQEHLEEAGEAAELRRRHAEHYATFAEDAAPHLHSGDQLAWLPRMERETDNFRAAVDTARDQGIFDAAARVIASIAVNSTPLGFAAQSWAEVASDIPTSEVHPLQPAVLSWAAWGAVMHGEMERAAALVTRIDEAQNELGVRLPSACQGPVTLAWFTGDLDAARRRADEWVALARAGGDPYELAHALTMQGTARGYTGDEGAAVMLDEAVRIGRERGIASVLSIGLTALGGFLAPRDPERARAVVDEALAVASSMGDRQMVAAVHGTRAAIAVSVEDWPAALRGAVAGARAQLDIGDLGALPTTCLIGAFVLARLGTPEPAGVLLGAGKPEGVAIHAENVERSEALLARALGQDRLEELRARGAAMDIREAASLLLTEGERVLAAINADTSDQS